VCRSAAVVPGVLQKRVLYRDTKVTEKGGIQGYQGDRKGCLLYRDTKVTEKGGIQGYQGDRKGCYTGIPW
jgi:hypothetical protein